MKQNKILSNGHLKGINKYTGREKKQVETKVFVFQFLSYFRGKNPPQISGVH